MDIRTLLAFGTGVGIEIGERDLSITIAHVRPAGVKIAASGVIENFRERPAGEWGSEYLRFLAANGASHLAATVIAPKREVIVRQIVLPGVANKDFAAAVGFQVEALHPYGDEEISYAWRRVSDSGATLIGIMRRPALDAYLERFSEAGVSLACFTFSAAALHGAARLYTAPRAEGFVALAQTSSGEIEAYGESPSRAVFSAQFDLPAGRAASLAAAELRLPPDTDPLRIDQILPVPSVAPATFDLRRNSLGYAASLVGACPRLAPAANLLPETRRSSNSRMMFVPSAILAGLLLVAAGAVFGYSRIEEKHYLAELDAASAKLEPQVKKIPALDKSVQLAHARARLLDEFRGRSKYDLDTLNELTKILAPPIWTNGITITRDAVTVSGEAEQAAPLLRIIDGSPFFRDSSFGIPIARAANTELFSIRAARRPR